MKKIDANSKVFSKLIFPKRVEKMKITIKALLVNISNEYQEKIDELMSVFSSAKRFAYKRLLEDDIKKGEIEKLISNKYGLNIRQSKDAVETARPVPTTITSSFLLLAGLTNFWSALYFVHFSLSGPCGILELSVTILYLCYLFTNIYFTYYLQNNTNNGTIANPTGTMIA